MAITQSKLFQHTAARRRLRGQISPPIRTNGVSTHSRAEAAAIVATGAESYSFVSTHSRAEAAANKYF